MAVEIAEASPLPTGRTCERATTWPARTAALGRSSLEERPEEALKLYQRAAMISEELSAAEPSNTNYRQHFALSQMGIGESLHKLGKNREALQKLTQALEIDEISRRRGPQ